MCLFCAKCIGTLEGRWHSLSQVRGQTQEDRARRVGGGPGLEPGFGPAGQLSFSKAVPAKTEGREGACSELGFRR